MEVDPDIFIEEVASGKNGDGGATAGAQADKFLSHLFVIAGEIKALPERLNRLTFLVVLQINLAEI